MPPNVIDEGHPRDSARQTSAIGASAVREVAGGICNFFLQVFARSDVDYRPAFGFGRACTISAAEVRPPCSFTILLKNTIPCRSIRNVEG